jgi:predicted AAA+ superfamily ATPase
MLIKRPIVDIIARHNETPQVVVLTGMRRVGKTSVFKMLYDGIKSDNKVFLDIENPIDQKAFEEKDFNNIPQNLKAYGIDPEQKAYVFLDEIQAAPGIVTAIKYLSDHHGIKFFVTGSSSYYMKNLFPESLSGRKVVFELGPLDFSEFLLFKGISAVPADSLGMAEKSKNPVTHEKWDKLYEEYLSFGGFPQVVLAKMPEMKREQLKDIFKSYFEKDVVSLAQVRERAVFRDMMLLLLNRAGGRVDISKISFELGISRETVYSYLSFLEDTFFVHTIRPFSRSREREISGMRKVYLCDCGIVNMFAKVTEGALFENAAYLNLRKYGSMYYYTKRNETEIDFILPEISCAVEVKMTGQSTDYSAVYRKIGPLGLKHAYLVTKKYSNEKHFIPATFL